MKSRDFVFITTFGVGQILVPYFEMKRFGHSTPDYHPKHQQPMQVNSSIYTYGPIDYYRNLNGLPYSTIETVQLATLANE